MPARQTTPAAAGKFEGHKSLISSALILWGASAVISGAATAYTNTAVVYANMKAATYILAPYALSILGGVFNLLFGIVLVALGRKIRNSEK